MNVLDDSQLIFSVQPFLVLEFNILSHNFSNVFFSLSNGKVVTVFVSVNNGIQNGTNTLWG